MGIKRKEERGLENQIRAKAEKKGQLAAGSGIYSFSLTKAYPITNTSSPSTLRCFVYTKRFIRVFILNNNNRKKTGHSPILLRKTYLKISST